MLVHLPGKRKYTKEGKNSGIDEYDLTTEDILRHYDCGGKLCPIYYVEHEDAWERLLLDVEHSVIS